jgi:hypothetical protein
MNAQRIKANTGVMGPARAALGRDDAERNATALLCKKQIGRWGCRQLNIHNARLLPKA